MKEQGFREKGGKGIRNAALVAGGLGLFFVPEIVIPSIVLAVAGEIWSSSSEKAKEA